MQFFYDKQIRRYLVQIIRVFSNFTVKYGDGTLHQIPVSYVLQSPLYHPMGFGEGYHLYDYRDELNVGDYKYLYIRASFKNAKTGKETNLMVTSTAQPIDNLIHELYIRVKLYRTSTGYYYNFDDTYQGNGVAGPNNVSYTLNPKNNKVIINLYQIKAI